VGCRLVNELTLLIPIAMKSVVTANLRQELTDEIQEGISQMDLEIQQIEFQGRRALSALEREDLKSAMAFRGRIEEEKKKRTDMKSELLAKIEEINALPEGTEIQRGTVQAQVVVAPGTDLAALSRSELLIKDGIILEIRSETK